MEVKVGTLSISNDKNNVIAKNALSYFYVFKLQVWSAGRMFQD